MANNLWTDENGFILRSLINWRTREAAEKIRMKISETTEGLIPLESSISAAIIRGSGMQTNAVRNGFRPICAISFNEFLPFALPPVFAGGHKRELVIFLYEPTRKLVAEFYGRVHYYDVLDQIKATFIIRVLKHLKCRILIILNAAGGCKPELGLGDFVVLNHGDLTSTMPDPHLGIHPIRFFDPASTYDKKLSEKMLIILGRLEIRAHHGGLAVETGTSYESPRERQKLINDPMIMVAGMSNYNEAMVAAWDTRDDFQEGESDAIQVLGISVISNNHTFDQPVTHEEVAREMKLANPKIDLATALFLSEVL